MSISTKILVASGFASGAVISPEFPWLFDQGVAIASIIGVVISIITATAVMIYQDKTPAQISKGTLVNVLAGFGTFFLAAYLGTYFVTPAAIVLVLTFLVGVTGVVVYVRAAEYFIEILPKLLDVFFRRNEK